MGELGGLKGGEASVGIYYMRRIKTNKPTNQNSLLAFPAENRGRSGSRRYAARPVSISCPHHNLTLCSGLLHCFSFVTVNTYSMTTMSHHLPFQSISPHDSSLKLCFVSCQILQNYQFVLWFLFVTMPLISMGIVIEHRLCSPKIFGITSLRKGLWLKRDRKRHLIDLN